MEAQSTRLRVVSENIANARTTGDPAANAQGMVKYPNVNVLIEMADLREANRSYEANLQSIKQTRDLISSTIDLLKG